MPLRVVSEDRVKQSFKDKCVPKQEFGNEECIMTNDEWRCDCA